LDTKIPLLTIGLAFKNAVFGSIQSYNTNHSISFDYDELLIPLGTLFSKLLKNSIGKVVGDNDVIVANKLVIGRDEVGRVLQK